MLVNELIEKKLQVVYGVSDLKKKKSVVYPVRNRIQNLLAGQTNTESFRVFRKELKPYKPVYIDVAFKHIVNPYYIGQVFVNQTDNKEKKIVYKPISKLMLFMNYIPLYSINPFLIPTLIFSASILLHLITMFDAILYFSLIPLAYILILLGIYISLIYRKICGIPDFVIIEKINL
jgi:hypothetical protein